MYSLIATSASWGISRAIGIIRRYKNSTQFGDLYGRLLQPICAKLHHCKLQTCWRGHVIAWQSSRGMTSFHSLPETYSTVQPERLLILTKKHYHRVDSPMEALYVHCGNLGVDAAKCHSRSPWLQRHPRRCLFTFTLVPLRKPNLGSPVDLASASRRSRPLSQFQSRAPFPSPDRRSTRATEPRTRAVSLSHHPPGPVKK